MQAATITETHITVPTAARLIGVTRVVAWGYARSGLFGEIYTHPTNRRIYISIAELQRRYSIDPDKVREITR